jgi:hypothetical protein
MVIFFVQGGLLHGKKAWENSRINKMFVGSHIPYDLESCRMVSFRNFQEVCVTMLS